MDLIFNLTINIGFLNPHYTLLYTLLYTFRFYKSDLNRSEKLSCSPSSSSLLFA